MRILPLSVLLLSTCLASSAFAVAKAPLDSANKPDLSAAAQKSSELADQNREDIARIEAYLTAINSIVADFSQASTDGSKGTGKFFLKRPGKMRWQYNPPTPILLVCDGKTVTYYDAGLDQVSYVGVDDTLAAFLVKKEIKLDSETTRITGFKNEKGELTVTIVQRKKPDDGSLTLKFIDKPLDLKELVATDATGTATTVTFANAQFGPVLEDKLFVFEDPRGVNKRRNRRS